jgi:hypothetical protein
VEPFDGSRLAEDEELVAALVLRPAEVVGVELLELEVRAGGAVEHEHPLAERAKVGRGCRVEAAEEGGGRHRSTKAIRCRHPVAASRSVASGPGRPPVTSAAVEGRSARCR